MAGQGQGWVEFDDEAEFQLALLARQREKDVGHWQASGGCDISGLDVGESCVWCDTHV